MDRVSSASLWSTWGNWGSRKSLSVTTSKEHRGNLCTRQSPRSVALLISITAGEHYLGSPVTSEDPALKGSQKHLKCNFKKKREKSPVTDHPSRVWRSLGRGSSKSGWVRIERWQTETNTEVVWIFLYSSPPPFFLYFVALKQGISYIKN